MRLEIALLAAIACMLSSVLAIAVAMATASGRIPAAGWLVVVMLVGIAQASAWAIRSEIKEG